MASLIVAGSTGAIGRCVVAAALRQPQITKVVALTRAKDVKKSDYEKLFGLKGPLTVQQDSNGTSAPQNDAPSSAEWEAQLAKLEPVTMDWDAFMTFWAAYSAHCASSADTAMPDTLKSQLAHYRPIFSGHTFAAMCMGTTRSDAGGAKGFIRCDYDYVLGFVEATLAFSAPGGYPVPQQKSAQSDKSAAASLNDGLVYHIGDQTEKAKSATGQPSEAAIASAAALSTHTLHCLCQVSAYNAKASSWFLYMKTKGTADDAVAERVHQHNTLVAPVVAKVVAGSPLVYLSYIRPGLLARGDKVRSNEKLMSVVSSAMPVATCGACIVSDFVAHAHDDTKKAEALWAGETCAEPLVKPKKKGEKPADPFYVYYNDQIKKQAKLLDTKTS